ncbi:MAG: class I SAM-dependent rRNA methyltransferase [Myxococcales bacterium]|nr:class I SAM-dependent rRNA methyltransferase [Myxococcales bacterium]
MTTRVELRRDAGRVSAATGPWIRRRQVARVRGAGGPVTLAEVVDHRDRPIGWGLVSEAGDIAVRMIAFTPAPPPEDWLPRRLAAAIGAREALARGDRETDAWREVNSEGDGLPGLVVDRYAEDRVIQVTTAAMSWRLPEIVAALAPRTSGRLFVTTTARAIAREEVTLSGRELGDAALVRPPGEASGDAPLSFRERGLHLQVPAPPAQKTGAYLDQRDNRERIAALAAALAGDEGGALLDVGCHVGGFALQAARRGLRAVGVDQSEVALERARDNAVRNHLVERTSFVRGDLFTPDAWLPEVTAALAGRTVAAAVVDPPAIARARKDLDRARGALARALGPIIPLIGPRGVIALCSCSHHLGGEVLDAVALAAAPAGALTRILALGPAPDHPVAPGHREGEYLRVHVYQRR